MRLNRIVPVSGVRSEMFVFGAVLFLAGVLAGCGGTSQNSSSSGGSSSSITANPSTISFGNVIVGASTTKSAYVINSGSSSVTISKATVAGSGYSVAGIDLPVTLSAGQTLTYTITYGPQTSGASNGSLTVVSDASNSTLSIVLSGTGVAAGQLSANPSTLNFGNVNTGQSKSLSGSLTASSTDITISSANLTGTWFSLSGITFPKTIAAGQSAGFAITFTPTASGTSDGSVSFVSNASSSPNAVGLSGTGVQTTTPHSVSLSWMESSTSVQGYYVYRGDQTGGPYSRISGLQTLPSYVDSSVTSGATYHYVVTAVGTNSAESGYSNEAVAVIPQ